jgi:hypothetical protein
MLKFQCVLKILPADLASQGQYFRYFGVLYYLYCWNLFEKIVSGMPPTGAYKVAGGEVYSPNPRKWNHRIFSHPNGVPQCRFIRPRWGRCCQGGTITGGSQSTAHPRLPYFAPLGQKFSTKQYIQQYRYAIDNHTSFCRLFSALLRRRRGCGKMFGQWQEALNECRTSRQFA